MFMIYLLWITLVFGGLFMGAGAIRVLLAEGFDFALLLNAVFYTGIAFYSLPRLIKLLTGEADVLLPILRAHIRRIDHRQQGSRHLRHCQALELSWLPLDAG